EENSIKVSNERVLSVSKECGFFKIRTDKGTCETKSVIVASGARPRQLNVKGESEFRNRGLTYCSICDGPLFPGVDVAVVGGGNAALEAASYMLGIASKIYILTNEGGFRAFEHLQEKVLSNPKVHSITNAKVTEVFGGKFVEGVKYEVDGVEKTLGVSGVIVEIGRMPNTDLFKGFLDLDSDGHIMINCRTETSVPGVFAAGDCADGHEYQYVIAAGQGAMALIKAARYLNTLKEV
ncbi:MAG: NAD(P)/FAD-dependent oxidoreductase, partial [Candidatus Altiarchaeota archaeon]|nr:NAD(P)/FAD-dependent oxidoreductase [Candidatus Altiarchaeota archaeon]